MVLHLEMYSDWRLTERMAMTGVLLDKGADVDSTDDKGRTPLSWAAEYRHAAIVKLLQPNLPS